VSAELQRARELAEGLYPHQVEGLTFLLARRGAILADDMGLGKTRQAILALHQAQPDGPYLVVCPASVKLNWKREIEAVRPDDDVHIVGDEAPHAFTGWVVINYDLLKKHIGWLHAMPFAGLVFDEAHYLKNYTSQRSKLGRSLVESAHRPLTYMLTGTPLTNRPRDLFPLLSMVDHPLGRHFLTFAKRYCGAFRNRFGWVTDGATNLDELALALEGVLLRRTKSEVLDLPPKVRTFIEVDIPQTAARADTRKLLEMLVAPGAQTAHIDLLAQLTKSRHALAIAKAKTTQSYVANAVEQGEKVIVYSCFDAPVQQFAEHFGDQAVLLTGETKTTHRQALVDRFQNDDSVRVFIANLQAGGVGVNLTAARQVVFNDLDWVPANHFQAEDRAYRIGQTESVNVEYMVAPNTLDAFIQYVLETKARIAESVIDGKPSTISASTNAVDDLQRAVSPLADAIEGSLYTRRGPNWAGEVLAQALQTLRAEQAAAPTQSVTKSVPKANDELIAALARVIGKPAVALYQVTSTRDPHQRFTVTVNANEITCSCSGFGHRGSCSHVLPLRRSLALKQALPAGYERIAIDG
jgi:SWI/SNF-related matrix-associated actin-dependent regulator 1 of chromatin subfamily A